MLEVLWEMSLTGAYAAAILIVLRLVLKKRAPRQVLCLLWLVVFARLLIPVSLESPLSIVPDARPVQGQLHLPQQEAGGQTPANPATPTAPAQGQNPGTAANPVISNPGEPTLTPPEGISPDVSQPEAPAPFPWRTVISGVWLAGVAAMAGCGLISCLRLRRRLFDAIRAPDGAWEHPAVDSPFILGMIRPRIYLPAGLTGRPRQFILCHERAHLRRLDHIVKPVCWAALALHWFNPLVWAAYILMGRDIEAACDEAVIRRLGSQVKADYSTTLLALATGRRIPAPSPLAFDEGDAKGRIKNVLGYRRPALWVIVVSVIAAVLAAVCLLTDPVAAEKPGDSPDPGPTASASQPPEASLADALLDPWMKEVLDGERQFISAYFQHSEGDGRTYGIHDLRTFYYGDDQYPDAVVEAGRVAVIDLDRDGINELVIWPEGEYEYLYSVVGYVILRRQGDEIYAYNPGYRTFGNVKSDGSFSWSNGAPWSGCATLTFGPGEVVLQETTYHKPGESEIDQLYFVDGRRATKEEHSAAQNREFLKPDLAWFTYKDGQLQPYLPAGVELIQSSETAAKVWLEDGQYPWLEWNGFTWRLAFTATAGCYPTVADFDGDGQDEIVIIHYQEGFPLYHVYERNGGQLTYADTFDTQALLLRFNQNNVAAYNKDTREFSVTYAHTEGDPDSEDYYRRYITGSCTLPEDFFDYRENIRDGYLHAYANDFRWIYFNPDNSIHLEMRFYPSDEAFLERDRIDNPWALESERDDSFFPEQHYISQPVGTAAFTLSYDGAKWVLEEPDRLSMGTGEESADPYSIYTAAPLSAPVVDLMNGIPDDPNQWYKVAELPDDMIWVYSRNRGEETLIRWDGNFYKVFNHTAHTARSIPPALKKLGSDPNFYGPLAVISNVGSGTGVSLDELVVYELDVSGVPSYVHDWKPLVDEFNGGRAFRYDGNTHSVICTYEGQTAELIIDGGDNEELYRRIDEEGIRLAVTGEIVSYRFNEDGAMEIEFPLQVFIGDDVVGFPLLWPWFLRWTIRFDSGRAEFETVPGSCELFTYVGQ